MEKVYFYKWLKENTERDIYAIVDPLSRYQPHIAFYQLKGINGSPLIDSDIITTPEKGPWLLPVNTEFLEWWSKDQNSNSGIIISTDSSYKEIKDHFSSLFQAIMQGERVFFLFYKPHYITTMLLRLQPEEITALFREHHVLIRYEEEWYSWKSENTLTKDSLYQLQTDPWWVIKDHHLDNTPNQPLLASNVETWLWIHQPELMQARIEQNQANFKPAFQVNFSAFESTSLAQGNTLTIQEATIMASIVTAYSPEILTPKIQETISLLKDDELLFGLKTVFTQLRGQA